MAADPHVIDVILSAVRAAIFTVWGVWLHRAWEIHRERRADRRCAHRLTTTTTHRRTR